MGQTLNGLPTLAANNCNRAVWLIWIQEKKITSSNYSWLPISLGMYNLIYSDSFLIFPFGNVQLFFFFLFFPFLNFPATIPTALQTTFSFHSLVSQATHTNNVFMLSQVLLSIIFSSLIFIMFSMRHSGWQIQYVLLKAVSRAGSSTGLFFFLLSSQLCLWNSANQQDWSTTCCSRKNNSVGSALRSLRSREPYKQAPEPCTLTGN